MFTELGRTRHFWGCFRWDEERGSTTGSELSGMEVSLVIKREADTLHGWWTKLSRSCETLRQGVWRRWMSGLVQSEEAVMATWNSKGLVAYMISETSLLIWVYYILVAYLHPILTTQNMQEMAFLRIGSMVSERWVNLFYARRPRISNEERDCTSCCHSADW